MHTYQNKRVEPSVADPQRPRSKPHRGPQVSVRRPRRLRLDSAINEYLGEVQTKRSVQAADRLRWLLDDFRQLCPKIYLQAITSWDLVSYMAQLRERRLADCTIFNRISTLLTFLRSSGINGLLSRQDLPRYTERFVDAYSEQEIAQLLQSGDERSRAIFGFFLGTGCREQEVAFMIWSDVDLDQKIVRITAKPQWGWRPKDCEERGMPIPAWLADTLKQLQKKCCDSSLLFPNQLGQPEGHFLGKLKALALCTDLNCGHCVNRRAILARTSQSAVDGHRTNFGGRLRVGTAIPEYPLEPCRPSWATRA
jgi:integrase